MKYECECIKDMELVKSYKNCIQSKQTTAFTSLFLAMFDWINKTMNESDEVWRWLHQKYVMVRIVWKLYSFETNKCIYLDVPGNGKLNWQNNEWEWWSMNLSASKLWNESNHKKIVFSQGNKMHSPCCSQLCSIELTTKQWMGVMNYEGECIKTMEWVESYENCIKSKQKNSLALLFLMVVDWMDKTIKIMTCNAQIVTITIV